MADAESLELFSACLASRRFMRSDYLIRVSLAARQYRENRRGLRESLYIFRPAFSALMFAQMPPIIRISRMLVLTALTTTCLPEWRIFGKAVC